ncbi:uncharacterized protein LOC131429087 [Malaya genurostris]|uniref:uncharacterized protein LOC131429087 n=1 Tax=Malaya genurostris TaxID=325434 RepID=UPI0026F40038|nr:uncharacterized protein LOC131429087 [Malaya genurostris]
MATSRNCDTPQTPTEDITSSCVNCERPDSADNFVQCDNCDTWWHMSCAGVSESIEGRPWSCRKCVPDNASIRTVSSTTRAARLALQLEELEAKRALEKQSMEAEKRHLDEVFQLRKAQLECEEESMNHSQISMRQSLNQVRQWMEKCADPAVGDLSTASLSMPLPTSHVDPITEDNNPGRNVIFQTRQISSPLKHPSLQNVLQRTSMSTAYPVNQQSGPAPAAYNKRIQSGAVPKANIFDPAKGMHKPVGNPLPSVGPGSSLTLIEEKLANELGADGIIKPLCLMWTGNVTRMETTSKQVTLTISALNGNAKYKVEDARTVKELSLPKQTVSFERLMNRYRHLQGLPVASYENATPRLMIGVNNLNLIVPLRTKEGLRYEPVAVKTRLSWCVYGGKTTNDTTHTVNCHSCDCTVAQELHNTLKDYFALEDIATKEVPVLMSEEEKRAQCILEKTTIRIGKRFETGLLWRFDHIELPDSYNMALKRLECLEKKLAREPLLKEIVQEQLSAYQNNGYAHLATKDELLVADLKRVWYLPLGIVKNPRKPGKVRLIWDAAAKVKEISLNTMLLKGPDQLTSLPAVLLRFRPFKVGISADIKEMFHQISIRREDRHSQRFLWRSDPSHTPEIFLMDVATFGSSCSPASAQFVKNKNAEEIRERYPRAVKVIVENHYVDDCLESFESTEEAVRVSREMRMIHEEGGFLLRSWRSNSREVLKELEETNSAGTNTVVQGVAFERVLGLLWSTETDELYFSTMMSTEISLVDDNQRPTKRQILKCLMGFFDPLGLLSLFHIHGKMLLQDVWRSGIEWDELVSDRIFERWQKWTKLFEEVSDVRIPRCYFHQATVKRYDGLQLHVFVDASEVAYSVAVYFRLVNSDGVGECTLVSAKAKVAPLKPLSVPRMELQAAVLGSRLMKFVEEVHCLAIVQKYLWSDSATVLSWLRADHRRYKQFVACRIGELLTTTNVSEWRWVPSKSNPADAATKWGQGPKLTQDSMWFKGPEFLRGPEISWPIQKNSAVDTEEELRPCYSHSKVVLPKPVIDLDRFSKLSRVVRTAAYVARFLANLKRKQIGEEAVSGILTSEELKSAEYSLIRMVQWQAFPDEMAIFVKNQRDSAEKTGSIGKSSVIFQLSPILDDNGLLRVGGRIGKAPNINLEAKFPVILPRNHKFTVLLLDDYHRKFRDGNHETVTNEIRQKYYVPRLRRKAKRLHPITSFWETPVAFVSQQLSQRIQERTSWSQIQYQLDVFWRRWTREYLPTLTKRTKWFGDVKPVAEGDLVYIVDGDRRNGWERGRVQTVLKGADGKVRQAII